MLEQLFTFSKGQRTFTWRKSLSNWEKHLNFDYWEPQIYILATKNEIQYLSDFGPFQDLAHSYKMKYYLNIGKWKNHGTNNIKYDQINRICTFYRIFSILSNLIIDISVNRLRWIPKIVQNSSHLWKWRSTNDFQNKKTE